MGLRDRQGLDPVDHRKQCGLYSQCRVKDHIYFKAENKCTAHLSCKDTHRLGSTVSHSGIYETE